jgi:hypothetical protein
MALWWPISVLCPIPKYWQLSVVWCFVNCQPRLFKILSHIHLKFVYNKKSAWITNLTIDLWLSYIKSMQAKQIWKVIVCSSNLFIVLLICLLILCSTWLLVVSRRGINHEHITYSQGNKNDVHRVLHKTKKAWVCAFIIYDSSGWSYTTICQCWHEPSE